MDFRNIHKQLDELKICSRNLIQRSGTLSNSTVKNKLFICTILGFFLLCLGSSASAQDKVTLQRDYAVFETQCSQCHSLSKVTTNNNYILPSEIRSLVQNMSAQPGANISSSHQDQIYDFLVYYMAIKKTDILKQDLESLPEARRNQEIQEIKSITEKYK